MDTKEKCLERFDIEKATEMMYQCKTLAEIGEYFNMSPQRVSEMFKSFGVKFIRRKTPINDKFFDHIDSELKAYALGFLIADGCIKHEVRKSGNISYRIAFNNSIDDEEAITAIHKAICPGTTLVKYLNKGGEIHRKKSFVLLWSSEYMCKVLEEKYKILPRKTLDIDFKLPENAIPTELWRHLIRGFFDGDGHMGDSNIEFIFTSKNFMLQILNFFPFRSRIYEIEGKTCKYYKVIITGGKEVLEYTKNFFYKDATIYLSRKRNLFNSEVTSKIAQGLEVPLSVETE